MINQIYRRIKMTWEDQTYTPSKKPLGSTNHDVLLSGVGKEDLGITGKVAPIEDKNFKGWKQ
jgi:hypothetical protein